MLVTGLAIGALLGLGVTLVARGLLAGPVPLAEALRGLNVDDPNQVGAPAPSLPLRAADALSAGLGRFGLSPSVRDADLRVAERSREQHHVEKLAGAVAGLALPPVLTVVTRVGGVATPVALAALGDALPPAAMAMFETAAPVSSMTWQFELLSDDPTTEDGWWLSQSRAETIGQGYASQAMTIWNHARQPILVGRQSVAVFY